MTFLFPDQLGQPRILGPAKSNVTLMADGDFGDLGDLGDLSDFGDGNGGTEVREEDEDGNLVSGPVAYLSCEVVSLGSTQVRG